MNRLNRSLLAAAVAAVFVSGVFESAAQAQTRVDRSGATDANRRTGSGGRNTVGGRANPWDIQNNIVYNNVTGGKGFRGTVNSTDPQAFRGYSASSRLDSFVRDSSSVSTNGLPSYNASQTRAYYGDSRNVPPPAGFVGVTTSGGYTPPVPLAWNNVDVRGQALSRDTKDDVYTPASQTGGAGAVDSIYAPNTPASAAVNPNAVPGRDSLSDYTNLNTTTVSQLTPSQIKLLQGDDPQSQIPGQTPANGSTTNSPVDPAAQQNNAPGNPVNNVGGARPLTGGNGTDSSALNNAAPSGAFVGAGAAPLNNSVSAAGAPEVGTVTRMTPKVGTPQKAGEPADTDDSGPKRPGQAAEDATREYNAQVRAAKKADADKNGDKTDGKTDAKPGDAKPGDAKPGDVKPEAPAGGPPTKVGTFTGGNDKGLSDLLTKAEGQMKEGKYATAIDSYGAAEAVAPRNATVKLGRANAELGGAFYRRAEASLRQAFTADKNLLKNQYDLRSFLGDDRLQTVTKDLNDLVQNRDKDTGAAVLLAYVYYNTGNENRAKALLDLADKRANGRDALVRSMKTGWTFGGADETK